MPDERDATLMWGLSADDADESEPDPELLQAWAERDQALARAHEREHVIEYLQSKVWELTLERVARFTGSLSVSWHHMPDPSVDGVPIARAEGPTPDYIGPVIDGKAVPDPVHERVHETVKDILAGRVLPKARKQLSDALSSPPPDAPTTASKSQPMPGGRWAGSAGDMG